MMITTTTATKQKGGSLELAPTTTRPTGATTETESTREPLPEIERRGSVTHENQLEHANTNKVAQVRIPSSETEEFSLNESYQMHLLEAFKIIKPIKSLVAATLLLAFLIALPITASHREPNERLQLANHREVPVRPGARYRQQQQQQQTQQALNLLIQSPESRSQQPHLHLLHHQRQQHQQQGHQLTFNQQETLTNGHEEGAENHQSFRGASMAHLLAPNMGGSDLQQQASYWTSDLWPAASNQLASDQTSGELAAASSQNKHHFAGSSGNQPLVSAAVAAAAASGSTTPTINRQLVAPPSFYEIGLAPANAIQIEMADVATQQDHQLRSMQGANGAHRSQVSNSNGAVLPHEQINLEEQLLGSGSSHANNRMARHNGSARSIEHAHEADNQSHNNPTGGNPHQGNDVNNNNNNNNKNYGDEQNTDKAAAASGQDGEQQQQPPLVDKTIEPRQRRRIFNRILKKAEWNHLFVELSKVFLRYFLDLALKDIIGKQSGAETTTSRKKLDAQSELTDLLKDFVKTAISNI